MSLVLRLRINAKHYNVVANKNQPRTSTLSF